MEKPRNHFLVEIVVMYSASAKDMISRNMLQIWKLIRMVTFKELNKAKIKFYPLKNCCDKSKFQDHKRSRKVQNIK
jgi:hypothetical protein